jgi:hypothetical protein
MGQFGNYRVMHGQPLERVGTKLITEPSAIAPDAKGYVGNISFPDQQFVKVDCNNLLRTQVDSKHPALSRSVL